MIQDPEISVVIPLFNEEANVASLVAEVTQALGAFGRPYELILVDDGSPDGTFRELKRLKETHPELVALRFRRNFGQTAAMKAGFDAARAPLVVSLDGDLQNDPGDIPMLIRHLEEEDLDVVSGWRRDRQDAFINRRLPSRIANWLIGRVTGVKVHDYGCSLRAYRAEVVKNLPLYGEMHRFIPALADLYGARIGELEVRHHPRRAGVSKYTISRTFRVVMDLLSVTFFKRFTTRPMHLFGLWGGVLFLSGFAIDFWLAMEKLFLGAHLADRPLLLMGTLLILVGVMLFGQGLVLEVMARTYYESQGKSVYTIRERI